MMVQNIGGKDVNKLLAMIDDVSFHPVILLACDGIPLASLIPSPSRLMGVGTGRTAWAPLYVHAQKYIVLHVFLCMRVHTA